MIFSEIYGLYFITAQKLLQEAISGTLCKKSFYEIINSTAFSESAIFFENAIENGEWLFIDKHFKSPYKFVPNIPLSDTQKMWLKTITLDKKIKLFLQDIPHWLEDVPPLFNPQDIIYPDRFYGGDDFDDAHYIDIFRTILLAIKQSNMLYIEYTSNKGTDVYYNCLPIKIEYSNKEDRFRLHATTQNATKTINISSIKKCELAKNQTAQVEGKKTLDYDILEFEIINSRNCLERALIHFSSFEKQTTQISNGTFLVKMKFAHSDFSEIVIRILQFGQFIKVKSPDYFVEKIKERIFNQKSCDI